MHMSSGSRYVTPQVLRDLGRKMVFVAGPRQVGKTTMARSLPGGAAGYLNWDVAEHRARILRGRFPDAPLWILDEVHKHRGWRNMVKGLWDGRRAGQRILVTGSARLDAYRRGGDSLQGRYHLLRMHPYSAAELGLSTPRELRDLLTLGGFPEPWHGGSEREARRWSREYGSRLVREEVRDLEDVSDLGALELLALTLPDRVGSPLSLNALREDLHVAHATVARWVDILERLYAVFRVPPFGPPRVRAAKKAPKHYHFDWTVVPAGPQRFENLVASHLLKWVQFEEDAHGRGLELRHFRDATGREVDFVVLEDRKPVMFVEAKWGDDAVDRGLAFLHARYPAAEAWQISATGTRDDVTPSGLRVAPALKLLRRLV
ncbi:MAG: hypothetical protein HMLKMBBP_02503 [Planctomycetes bacterium]|nr:hypothetical protein [Planctomycetota bacterium]